MNKNAFITSEPPCCNRRTWTVVGYSESSRFGRKTVNVTQKVSKREQFEKYTETVTANKNDSDAKSHRLMEIYEIHDVINNRIIQTNSFNIFGD